MPDTITIKQLQADALIGVYDWEQTVRQTVLIDIELCYDMRKAAHSDDLNAAVDYKTLCDRVVEHTESVHVQLIESLAEQLANLCLGEFAIDSCRISVHKPAAIAAAKDVVVSIERSGTTR
ncbi:MAG: dihydroneopterin aldolase [Pseudomonadales bacterium]